MSCRSLCPSFTQQMDSTLVEILAFRGDPFDDPFFDIFKTWNAVMTNHSEWLETNGNQMALICPVNMAGEVRLPNLCPVYIFLQVLLYTWSLFFQCLVQFYQLLFIANSYNRFTRFQQLVVDHAYFLDPTKYTASPLEHEYCVLALMDLLHLTVPMLFVIWRWLSNTFFENQSTKAKLPAYVVSLF